MMGPQRSTRQKSAQSIKFLRESEDNRAGTGTSWRERVRPIQSPTAAANKNFKRPPSASDKEEGLPEPFDLGRISCDWSSRDIHVCVNGKLSASPESAELTRTFARWKRTGSVQAEEDEEDSLLEEVLGLEHLLLAGPYQTSEGDQARQKKIPLCWDDLAGTTLKSHSPGESHNDLSKKTQEPNKGAEETSNAVKQLSEASPARVTSCHKESLLALEVMVTWADQCLLPLQLHCAPHSPKDTMKLTASIHTAVQMSSTSPHLEVSGRYAGSPGHSSAYKLVENILGKSQGAGRLIGVTKRCHLDDLLCLWLRCSLHGDKVQSVKLETCSFNVYLSETPNGKASTRVFKEVTPRRVVHNLYVFKFHLVSSLPWITDAYQLPGRTLGVSLYVSRPERFEGLVFTDWITLTPSPHAPSSPPGADQTSPPHAQHQPQLNHMPSVDQDEDKIRFAVDSSVLDTDSQQAQDFILSFYRNPYQVSTYAQERGQKGKSGKKSHNSETKRDTRPYTNLVQRHLGKYLDRSSTGKAAGSGSQAHIPVCSHPSSTKQKKKGIQVRAPHVVLPACEALSGDAVRSVVYCKRLGFLHQPNAGQKQDTIEEGSTTSWRTTVAMATTDGLPS